MNFNSFTRELLLWYPYHKRELPWRDTQNPYIIWLAEIILQQTRVAQGLPYFERFLEKYPAVEDLARASESEVLRLWQGLGYYSRARNLHHCAKEVVDKYNGQFPDTFDKLLSLKGIGRYTAAAIASFAFLEPVGVVDGNVFRVISRYFGIDEDTASPAGRKIFESIANQAISKEKPDEFNQAIMEFGALQCTPKTPDCENCPLRQGCFAYGKGLVSALPVKSKKVKVRQRQFLYHHITCGAYTVLRQRGEGDIWQGLHDFPLEEMPADAVPDFQNSPIINGLVSLDPKITIDPEKRYKHLLTHQRIQASFVKMEFQTENLKNLNKWAESKGFFLVNDKKMEALGKPKLIVNYLNDQK